MDYYEGQCIICRNKTERKRYDFCLDCYHSMQEIETEERFDKMSNSKLSKLYDDYYNDAICSIDEDELIENLQYLFAVSQHFDDNPAWEDNKEIQDSFYRKPSKEQSKKEFADNFKYIDYRKQWPNDFQCDDGHYVRSFYELILDNWLYHHNYRHEYEKSIYMPSDPNEIVLTDFFIPDYNVYIEVWGIENNQTYLDRENRKKALYDRNNFQRIDLTKEDLKRLNDILPREINKYKK